MLTVQLCPPAGCCQEIDENLIVGRSWEACGCSRSEPSSSASAPGSLQGVCSFYFRNEPHHLTPKSSGNKNLQVIFQVIFLLLILSQIKLHLKCLWPHISFYLSSTLDLCSFIPSPPLAVSCSGSSSSL